MIVSFEKNLFFLKKNNTVHSWFRFSSTLVIFCFLIFKIPTTIFNVIYLCQFLMQQIIWHGLARAVLCDHSFLFSCCPFALPSLFYLFHSSLRSSASLLVLLSFILILCTFPMFISTLFNVYNPQYVFLLSTISSCFFFSLHFLLSAFEMQN